MLKLIPFLLVCSVFGETRLGKPLALPAPVAVGELLAKPEGYVGKTVQVKGKVTEVCQMMGCWMALADPADPRKTIRVKVNDGDIVFPRDSAGKTAIAEGTLTRTILSKDEAAAEAKHEAEEQGRKFNPKSVKHGTTSYQIQGSGAVLVD